MENQESKYKVRTTEEEQQENDLLKRKTDFITRSVRKAVDFGEGIQKNWDLVFLFILILSLCIFGFFLCRIVLGMTIKEIQITIWEFVVFFVSVISGAGAIITQLYMKMGEIRKHLSGTVEKPHDKYGNSVISK
jgi:hypothetical protein